VTQSSADLFRCPSDSGSRDVTGTHFSYFGTSYRMNILLVGQGKVIWASGDPCNGNPKTLDEVNRRLPNLNRRSVGNESKLLLMGDAGWLTLWDGIVVDPNQLYYWHLRANHHNMAFMDGHVELVRIRKRVHTTPQYTLIPFADLAEAVVSRQREIKTGPDVMYR
jgi:prepilin-type processing-associated H-X9-DG protein